MSELRSPTEHWVVVGLDNGGTSNNATVLDSRGIFLVDRLVENASFVQEGPEVAIDALASAFVHVLSLTGTPLSAVRAVGLDTPGPTDAEGVISSKGATNFSAPEWRGFDFRAGLENKLQLPVIYNNDGNAAALYAHHQFFGPRAPEESSISAIVGTGLGGGVVVAGQVVQGVAGMGGELGHVHIPMHGLLEVDQPLPECNCGFSGDAESVASLKGIEKNLLPYWLTRFPDHDLNNLGAIAQAAKQVRSYAEKGDPMALRIFEQQAMALGRLFTIAANFTDPSAYFLGGGVVETTPQLRDWFMGVVRANTVLREEQLQRTSMALVPDLDMAGARGSAIAAMRHINAATG
ncbi:predicted NBD/HSP70 family sugar kinase [Jatrophihabitans sp. GAS493]|uniref:ROK family protein n=1 Tax=Jatrophihabitans sp. GAS493 TaxID=1907575 RepID=UPI000BB70D13|nr:ROK family protein [Jatrophihabitans sp. GAS493]SOD73658.1 predicted NBD/HSP70 family sugar kinase [Jatrophihabitans sp. GAS493]